MLMTICFLFFKEPRKKLFQDLNRSCTKMAMNELMIFNLLKLGGWRAKDKRKLALLGIKFIWAFSFGFPLDTFNR